MSERILTCIGCPMGCTLTATIENGTVTTVTGNTCRRGDDYARKECVAPERTVTGTVRLAGSALPVLSVRTAAPVPKDKVAEVAQAMGHIRVTAPIKLGDVIDPSICGTGVALIATRSA